MVHSTYKNSTQIFGLQKGRFMPWKVLQNVFFCRMFFTCCFKTTHFSWDYSRHFCLPSNYHFDENIPQHFLSFPPKLGIVLVILWLHLICLLHWYNLGLASCLAFLFLNENFLLKLTFNLFHSIPVKQITPMGR